MVSNGGEKSCMSDSKRRDLATGKWCLPHIYFSAIWFFHPFEFSPLHDFKTKSTKIFFLHVGIFLAPFSFYKNTRNIF